MSNVNTDGLPPEMQERIAQIIEGAKQKATAQFQAESPHQAAIAQPAPPAPAPVVRTPSLMDHTIQLRQEVAHLTQRVEAMGQVTEAVGNAVGQMYAMFQQQTTVTDPGTTYSQNFQDQVEDGDY
jgi:hypothetical protein